MYTYQDLQAVKTEQERMQFVLKAIQAHKASKCYSEALIADDYLKGENTTIKQYQKLLYTMAGKAVPDNYTANHKCKSGFLKRFITQEVAYLLKNGVTFEKEETYKKLGKKFNIDLYKYAKFALSESVSFGFFNNGKVDFFKLTEFVPLYDEENGALMAGIRFWQIDETKPLRATLYEIDGYTDYAKIGDKDIEQLREKRNYIQKIRISEADGEEIYDGNNYPSFPIVPLYGNSEKQSELTGRREDIDCYDLIKSGFANDLDDASMIYWTITNAGGMDDMDLAKFVERMKTIKAAVVDGDDGVKAESHTMEVPYQSREVYLTRLEKDLYRDFMALNTEQIAAGNVTATQIDAAYEALDEKAYDLQTCITDFINGIFEIAGIEDTPKFNPSRIVNRREETEVVLMAAEYLDEETILEKLPFLTDEEIDTILERKLKEDTSRFKLEETTIEEPTEEPKENTEE